LCRLHPSLINVFFRQEKSFRNSRLPIRPTTLKPRLTQFGSFQDPSEQQPNNSIETLFHSTPSKVSESVGIRKGKTGDETLFLTENKDSFIQSNQELAAKDWSEPVFYPYEPKIVKHDTY